MARVPGNNSLSALYLSHAVVLLAGLGAGLLAARFVLALDIGFADELRLARQLGIVSLTTINDYPKSRDILAYAVLMVLPVATAFGAWLLWARRQQRAALQNLLSAGCDQRHARNGAWRLCLGCVAALYLACSWNINYFYQPNGLWNFLGEEGEILAWAQAILSGKVYGRDFFCLYGPLLVYPVAWSMELFGATVVTERAYSLCLNLAAYGIIICFLYATCQTRLAFVVSAVVYLLAFSPLVYRSPNCSYLRVALGLPPLLCAYHYHASGKKALLAAGGAVIGLSLLFSQEVGCCSGIAFACCMLLQAAARRNYKSLPGALGLTLGSCLIVLMPMLVYLGAKGAAGPALSMMYEYPKLVALGYGSLPAPSFTAFLAEPLAEGPLLYYGVIGVYVFSAAFLMPGLLMGRLSQSRILTAGLIVFGGLLFRSALGRSDQYHVYYASQPAFVLLFLAIDRAVAACRAQLPAVRKAGGCLLVVFLLIFIRLLFANAHNLRSSAETALNDLKNATGKGTLLHRGAYVPGLHRAGVRFDAAAASTLGKIKAFLDARTAPGEYVYFFPHEAAYYFLFNRNNPTRYALASFAATGGHRRELVADLEKNRPRYVFYPAYDWRIDGLSDELQFPEIISYLQQRYRRGQTIDNLLVLERKDET